MAKFARKNGRERSGSTGDIQDWLKRKRNQLEMKNETEEVEESFRKSKKTVESMMKKGGREV